MFDSDENVNADGDINSLYRNRFQASLVLVFKQNWKVESRREGGWRREQ